MDTKNKHRIFSKKKNVDKSITKYCIFIILFFNIYIHKISNRYRDKYLYYVELIYLILW